MHLPWVLPSQSAGYFLVYFTIPPLFQSRDITELLMPLMILPPFDVGSSYHCVAMIILLLHTTLPCLILNVTSLKNTLIFYHSSSRPIFGTYFHQVTSPLLTIQTCLFSLPTIIAHFSISKSIPFLLYFPSIHLRIIQDHQMIHFVFFFA